jgi:hypothetical protein
MKICRFCSPPLDRFDDGEESHQRIVDRAAVENAMRAIFVVIEYCANLGKADDCPIHGLLQIRRDYLAPADLGRSMSLNVAAIQDRKRKGHAEASHFLRQA